ncbi:MAG: hypothetical protein JWL85_309 [Candidatus Saccharibacteria bacterium]|nr:hypothetical protein [Candidatus Saccharibacteria bacterium]
MSMDVPLEGSGPIPRPEEPTPGQKCLIALLRGNIGEEYVILDDPDNLLAQTVYQREQDEVTGQYRSFLACPEIQIGTCAAHLCVVKDSETELLKLEALADTNFCRIN